MEEIDQVSEKEELDDEDYWYSSDSSFERELPLEFMIKYKKSERFEQELKTIVKNYVEVRADSPKKKILLTNSRGFVELVGQYKDQIVKMEHIDINQLPKGRQIREEDLKILKYD